MLAAMYLPRRNLLLLLREGSCFLDSCPFVSLEYAAVCLRFRGCPFWWVGKSLSLPVIRNLFFEMHESRQIYSQLDNISLDDLRIKCLKVSTARASVRQWDYFREAFFCSLDKLEHWTFCWQEYFLVSVSFLYLFQLLHVFRSTQTIIDTELMVNRR